MDLSELFFGEFSIIIIGIFLIIILILLAKYVGPYPKPLPQSGTPRKDLRETILFWLVHFTWLSVVIFFLKSIFVTLIGSDLSYYFLVAIDSLILFIIPLIYVIRKNNWRLSEIGFTITKVESWKVLVFGISAYLILGVYSFFRSPHIEMYWFALLLVLYSNAFLEEFFYRGFIQSKLERAFGQKKALIYQGVIFTLVHIPAKTIQFSIDGNLLLYLSSFFLVFLHGTIYGLIYMKTRNLWASVICHYLTNWAVATILLFI